MDSRTDTLRLRVSVAIICIFVAASTIFPPCDAGSRVRDFQGPKMLRTSSNKPWKKLKSLNRLDNNSPLGSSSSDLYGSPSSLPLPPFNSLAPQPTPSSFGFPYPPFTPPGSASPYQSFTPPSSGSPYPPFTAPRTPGTSSNPTLPAYSPIPNPPHYEPSPPGSTLSPPKHAPNSPKSVPSPPQVYLPPLVYPPPPSSSPRHKKPQYANWCVAKPTVPDPIIKEAMDYACGSGADCKSIQPNGACYQPNTLLAHASYAFNSYWQNTKTGGGTCDFGGTAMLVTVDPSYELCRFTLI